MCTVSRTRISLSAISSSARFVSLPSRRVFRLAGVTCAWIRLVQAIGDVSGSAHPRLTNTARRRPATNLHDASLSSWSFARRSPTPHSVYDHCEIPVICAFSLRKTLNILCRWNEMKIVRALKQEPHPSIIPFHSFIITPSFAIITM